jgi:hypothetical protein
MLSGCVFKLAFKHSFAITMLAPVTQNTAFNTAIQRTQTQAQRQKCVSSVYENFGLKNDAKPLILLEASTGIEPVYTDLQSGNFR